MQHKDNSNHTRLTSPEWPVGCLYQSSKSGTRTVYLILLLGLLLTAAFPGDEALAGPPGPGAGLPPVVMVAAIIEQDVNPPAEYVGHIEAVQAVDLRARVEGFLEQVNFKEGSYVKAGRLLYRIEHALYQARIDADKALLAQAEAALTRARQYLKRARTVLSGGVSATELENAVAVELQARAQLEAAKANLKISQINLGYTSITAPISGLIGRTAFTMGNLVNPASGPLARIVQIDPIRVVYSISENDLAVIKMVLKDAGTGKNLPMLKPRIKLPGGQILEPVGQIDFVDNTVDPGTGTIAVRAVFDNPDGILLPGQYVTVMVTRSKPKLMTVVPQSAVLEDHDGRYVLVVDNQNRVIMRRIKTGALVGVNWAVESGLAVDEKVIVQGVQKARPGQIVKTVTSNNKNGR
jgi:membrane fusion protein (multidrug efflux system)